MRQRRPVEDDDMLITHLPSAPKALEGGEETDASTLDALDPSELAARLTATTDPVERARMMRAIQARLGNREAERIAAQPPPGEGA